MDKPQGGAETALADIQHAYDEVEGRPEADQTDAPGADETDELGTVAPVYLTRDQIIGAQDTVYEEVEVPEWGGVVRVRGLLAHERDEFEAQVQNLKQINATNRAQRRKQGVQYKWENVRALLLSLAIVNEHGAREFSEADIGLLGRKSAKAVDRVFDVAARLGGLTEEDQASMAEGFDEEASQD